MPIVPAPQKQPADIRQLPSVGDFTISADDMGVRGWGALADASQSLGRSVDEIARSHRRAGELKDAEDVERAATEYLDFADRELNGAVGEDGAVSGGLLSRTGAEARGTAKAWETAQRRWMDDPSRTYARLTPAQQQLFEQRIAPKAMRFRGEAVQHELAQAEAQRKADTEARALTNRRLAEHAYDKGDAVFGEAAGDAAVAAADRETYGLWRLEPDGSRTYKTPEAKAAWETARDAALDGIRAERAVNLAQRAALADLDDPGAADLLERAEAQAADEALSPEARKRAGEAVARAKRTRETLAATAKATEEARRDEARAAFGRSAQERYAQYLERGEDPDAAARDIFALAAAAGDAADPGVVIRYAGDLRAAAERRRQEAADALARKAQAADEEGARRAYAAMKLGQSRTANGEVVYLSSDDQEQLAQQLWIAGDLTAAQRDEIVAAAKSYRDPRLERFRRDALRRVPSRLGAAMEDLIVYDEETRRHEIAKDKKRPLSFGPDTPSGVRRTGRDERGKRRTETLLLGQVAEALDVFRERLANDPKYDERQAVKDFGEYLQPVSEEMARLTAAEHLARAAEAAGRARAARDAAMTDVIVRH